MDRFYVTTPIYYANDQPHVGHAYTTVAADVLARFWRSRLGAERVFFLTGTDEHGQKIADAATRAGQSPREFVDGLIPTFQSIWSALNISNDIFMRTTESEHYEFVQGYFEQLHKQDDIYRDTYEGFYCVGCEAYKTETELVDGHCPDHPNLAPERRKEENYFFRFTKYVPAVIEAIESSQLLVEPASRRNEVLARLKGEVRDISISRPGLNWGVSVPWDQDHTLYVWGEALLNYLSALSLAGKSDFWPASVQLMGKEILWFHAAIWPALLLAGNKPLPQRVFAHGWFTVDGQKMSKTVGNVIDPVQLVEQYGADATRYFLLSAVPFGTDGDIQPSRFDATYDTDLANDLGNLLQRVVTLLGRAELTVEPQGSVSCTPVVEALEALRLDEGLKAIWTIVRSANKDLETAKPWELMKQPERRDELTKVLTAAYRQLESIAAGLAPYLPETSERIVAQLQSGKAEPLFPRRASSDL